METTFEEQCDHCSRVKMNGEWVMPESGLKLPIKVDIDIGPPMLCPACRQKETERRALIRQGINGHNGNGSAKQDGFDEDIFAATYIKPITKCLAIDCPKTRVQGKWLPFYTQHQGQPSMLDYCDDHVHLKPKSGLF